MKKHVFTIFDFERIYGIVEVESITELQTKINTVFDGIRPPIEQIQKFTLEEILDFNEHEFEIVFQSEEDFEDSIEDRTESFFIQKHEII